jgi:hypothetical protein
MWWRNSGRWCMELLMIKSKIYFVTGFISLGSSIVPLPHFYRIGRRLSHIVVAFW